MKISNFHDPGTGLKNIYLKIGIPVELGRSRYYILILAVIVNTKQEMKQGSSVLGRSAFNAECRTKSMMDSKYDDDDVNDDDGAGDYGPASNDDYENEELELSGQLKRRNPFLKTMLVSKKNNLIQHRQRCRLVVVVLLLKQTIKPNQLNIPVPLLKPWTGNMLNL